MSSLPFEYEQLYAQVVEDNKARDTAIRTLIERSNHYQKCIASIFESIARHNEALEVLAYDNPHLDIPKLTTAPPANSQPKVGARLARQFFVHNPGEIPDFDD